MIVDTLENVDLYKNFHPNLYRGLQLIRDTDFSKYEPGTYKVDGDNLYFMVQEYNTKLINETPEAHKLYADIQYVIDGAELMGYAPLNTAIEEIPSKPGDIYFYKCRYDTVLLSGNRFFVAFPQDIHAPSISPDGSCAKARKIVVKVKL